MVERTTDRSLRTTFDEIPELYDRARPRYPPEVVDDVVDLAGVPAGGRILELGCGTGIATVPLAERGLEVVCVELGPRLTAFARKKLDRFPRASIVNASFETWTPPGPPFDAVVAFSAFHWLDPAVRYERSARALRAGGALAVVQTKHVLPVDGDAFFREVQSDYLATVPDAPKSRDGPPPRPEEVGDLRDEMEASGAFGEVAVRRRLWEVTYDADAYVALLDTFSGHRALELAARRRLYDRIRRRIASRPGATVRKTNLSTLTVGRRC